jgi:hypothetical protein
MKLLRIICLTKFCWLHIFAELTIVISESAQSVEVMDDTHISYNQEDEIRGLNVQLRMEGTNSNGHRGGREEDINLAETI